jgi:hypothetical protein
MPATCVTGIFYQTTEFSLIDGRLRIAKPSIADGKEGEACSHRSGLSIEASATVPDGMRWQIPIQTLELFAPGVK